MKKITVIINKEECVGKWCAVCVSVCPSGAIVVNDYAHIDEEKCNGCGKCVRNICPNYAIGSQKMK